MTCRGSVKAIILDFDGVVIESNEIKTEAFREIFSEYPEHLEKIMAYHHANISTSRFAKFWYFTDELLGQTGDQHLVDRLASRFSAVTVDKLVSCPFVPGAEEFLSRFWTRVPLFLASVTPHEDLMNILRIRNLTKYFQFIYGCPPWKKPGAVLDALERVGAQASEVVLIGDSPGDRDAADATGVEFIARDSGIAFNPPLSSIHKDLFEIGDLISDRIP